MSADDIWKINLRGYVIHTYRGTLTSQPGILKDSVEGRVWKKADDAGLLFFDRDHTHFRVVLNYLRDGKALLPKDQEKLAEIREEALFYKIDGLIWACNSAIR